MSFSETIPEDEILRKNDINEFHKKTKQLKQENNKKYVFIEVQDYL